MKKFKMLGEYDDEFSAHKRCRIHAALIKNMEQQKKFSVGVEKERDGFHAVYVLWLYRA